MIRCTKCGTLNAADASFCSECNSYLEWSGEPVEDPALPPPAEPGEPGPPDERDVPGSPGVPGEPAPPTDARSTGPTRPASDAAATPERPASAARRESRAGATRPPAAGRRSVADASSKPASGTGTAATPPSVADGSPPARRPSAPAQPPARRPAPAAVAPRPKPPKTPKAERPKPGDLVCPQCGTGNDPERKFCRRCGTSLAAAPVEPPPAPRPWYRRLLGREAPPAYEAGARPGGMGRRRWRPGCLSVLVVLGLLLAGAGVVSYLVVEDVRAAVRPLVRGVECRVREQVQGSTQPTLRAPRPGDPGSETVDVEIVDEPTFWVAAPGARMRVVLDESAYLVRVQLTPGERPAAGRPREVVIEAAGGSGDGVLATASVPNASEPSLIEVCERVRSFDIVVRSIHQGDRDRFAIQHVQLVVLREG